MYNPFTYPYHTGGIYPEKEEEAPGKLDRLSGDIKGFLVSFFRPKHGAFRFLPDAVNALRQSVRTMTDAQIAADCIELGGRLKREGFARELVSRVFALVREVADRRLGMPHYDVQLIGGWVLLNAMVAEMETGEGKTLVATLPACVMALAGVPVHIITVNDYLAKRDADWMRPIYETMGLTVGTVVHGMDAAARRNAYACDVTYCTNKEIAFDYLRDRIILWDRPTQMRLKVERLFGENSRIEQLVMRGLHYAIVDEADSILIDEARTPLIISSQADHQYDPEVYRHAMKIAGSLTPNRDFILLEDMRDVALTQSGKSSACTSDWENVPIPIRQEEREELVRRSIVAHHLFKPDRHYLVKDGKVQIIDEYTGRIMADRSWEMGLHQLIEVKEGCEVTVPKQTRARISYQRFFRRYLALAGMTGTAREVAQELWSVYRLRVVSMSTNFPTRREYRPDRVYSSTGRKWTAVIEKIREMQGRGRPVLIGTRSVEASEHLSGLLQRECLPHRVLNARQDREEADVIAMAGGIGRITVATNMAGRGTDIRLASGVAEKGGLFVLATERHESRRIDRQLFGRCARQGDPGTCLALVSLDDELIRVFIGKPFRWLAGMILEKENFRPASWAGTMVFRMAQWRAERLHSRMRRNLLKIDEQLSDSLASSGRFE
ncbi:MAG: preprotein translocase subunit SecA [Desulfobacterales bacterium]